MSLRDSLLATIIHIRNSECPETVIRHPAVQDVYPCKRYKMIATSEICRRCQAEPEFKQSLYALYLDGQAGRRDHPCNHRGVEVGKRHISCCGGTKNTDVLVHICTNKRMKVAEPDCWICGEFTNGRSPQPKP